MAMARPSSAVLLLAVALLTLLPQGRHPAGRAAASPQCKLVDAPAGTYQWTLQDEYRQLSLASAGNPARLRAALSRYANGKGLTITLIGGSVTAGQGAVDNANYPGWINRVLRSMLPGAAGLDGGPGVRVRNAAIPGTLSLYPARCHNLHVDPESDIVIVEFSINDHELA